MDSWVSKMGLGTSKLEAKWVLGDQNRGLEVPGTSKIGSWTVYKAVWRARGLSGRHLGGPRAGLDAILGPLGRPGRRFGFDFGDIWGSQTGPEKRFFGSGVEKYKLAQSFVFLCVFNDFGGPGATREPSWNRTLKTPPNLKKLTPFLGGFLVEFWFKIRF